MGKDLRPILDAILDQYELPRSGYHGVAHWARVLENGRRLSLETGADLEVVSLFAILHDSKRVNEGWDEAHGQRAADFALELQGRLFDLAEDRLRLLCRACAGHTHELTHPDITIQTCWDSDRLDLGRVGVTPHPSRLCTDAAKNSQIIKWADGRATFRLVPDFVTNYLCLHFGKAGNLAICPGFQNGGRGN
jgi:uncharacterized protein